MFVPNVHHLFLFGADIFILSSVPRAYTRYHQEEDYSDDVSGVLEVLSCRLNVVSAISWARLRLTFKRANTPHEDKTGQNRFYGFVNF
jgi:hypothetical protein